MTKLILLVTKKLSWHGNILIHYEELTETQALKLTPQEKIDLEVIHIIFQLKQTFHVSSKHCNNTFCTKAFLQSLTILTFSRILKNLIAGLLGEMDLSKLPCYSRLISVKSVKNLGCSGHGVVTLKLHSFYFVTSNIQGHSWPKPDAKPNAG